MKLWDYFDITQHENDRRVISLRNRFLPLTITGLTGRYNGKAVELMAVRRLPAHFTLNSDFDFRTLSALDEPDRLTILLDTVELGRLVLSEQFEINRLASLERESGWQEIFRKQYEVNVLLLGDEVIRSDDRLAVGINFSSFENDRMQPEWLFGCTNKSEGQLLTSLRKVKPATLRFAVDKDTLLQLPAFGTMCCRVDADPLVAVDLTCLTDEAILAALEPLFAGCDLDDFDTVSVELNVALFCGTEPETIEVASSRIIGLSQKLRGRTAKTRIVVCGANPDDDFGMVWNRNLIAACAHAFDFWGITWRSPGPAGWASDASPTDMAVVYGREASRLCRIADKLFKDIPQPLARPIVVTGWRYLRASNDALTYRVCDRKADSFFYDSAFAILSADKRFKLILADHDVVFRNSASGTEAIGAYLMQLWNGRQAALIKVRSVRDEPFPTADSTGVPGLAEAGAIPEVQINATRSLDWKTVYLIVQNRHPKKRLLAKVHFAGLPDLAPVQAQIIRAGKYGGWLGKLFGSEDSLPTLHEIRMMPYRAMDHVNLDLPPLGIVAMRLEAGQ